MIGPFWHSSRFREQDKLYHKKGDNTSRWNSNFSPTDNENFCICFDAFSGVCPVVNGRFSVVNRFVYNIT